MLSLFEHYGLELEFFLRIVLSSLCGAMIGFERTKRFKEAGIRTHCVVACGAALMMIVSKYGFGDVVDAAGNFLYGSRGADSSRIAAQVVSGVGFLGAGVIFRTGTSIKGLTTAAGIWATSAVGLALGAGMYLIGALTTLLIVAEQYLMHRLHFGSDAYTKQEISIQFRDSPEGKERLFALLEDREGIISSCSSNRLENGEISYCLSIRIKQPIHAQELQQMMDQYSDIRAFSV